MEKVTGIGGFFFRSKDPKSLADWYLKHLGINIAPTDMAMQPWIAESGVTVFAPFAHDTDYFSEEKAFMINFRVNSLAAMADQLRTAGIEISHEQTMEGVGKFFRIHDPEGNPIELWEPAE